MLRTSIAAMIVMMLAATGANAVELGDKQAGLAYARKFCVACHAVERGKLASPRGDAPSFQAAADSEGMSEGALAVWLQTSHPTMPDFIIPPAEIDNLIAYIMSLRAPRG